MPIRASYAAFHKEAWVAAWGLLFYAFSSRQNVHLCGYIHNYNLSWKAISSIWQAEHWPKCWPHVACAVNMLKYQTHLISPFWTHTHTQLRWDRRTEAGKNCTEREKEASPSAQTHFLNGLSFFVCCLLTCQFAGLWGMRTMEQSGSGSLSEKQSQRHVAFSHIQSVIVSSMPILKYIIFLFCACCM